MVEYVIENDKDAVKDKDLLNTDWVKQFEIQYRKICRFANFLSQQPNISMFVPAVEENGEWRILEKPNSDNYTHGIHFDDDYYNIDLNQYQTALDNVIFEGFRKCIGSKAVSNSDGCIILLHENKEYSVSGKHLTSIEQLTPYNLTLTPKFAKELGL